MQNVLALITVALQQIAATIADPAAQQVFRLLVLLFEAWPSIQKGLASEKPFLDAIGQLVTEGPLPADTFDGIIAGLRAQIAIVEEQVAADDAAITAEANQQEEN